MLHIIFTFPYYFDSCSFKNFLQKKDKVLLIQDGVFIGNFENPTYKRFGYFLSKKDIMIFAIKEDVKKRRLRISSEILQISYRGFVKLTEENEKYFVW
ncbi:hypothetical protein AOQ88_01715 [Candidatus Riesia sp. GBBU]|nr:hypothetical protein AOQ88_01715 [Candidatus Riesia sp. GBBU]